MKKIAIFDLDGTIIRENTFLLLIKFVLKEFPKRLKIWSAIMVIAYSVLRKFGFISRNIYKTHIYKLTKDVAESSEFIAICMSKMNKEIVNELDKLKPTHTIVLASAALPYARLMKNSLNADYVFTSYLNDNSWFENCSENKKNTLIASFNENDLFDVFYTDHAEDLPLARHCNQVVLVNPTNHSLNEFEKSGIAYKLILN
ncbi:MAG: HAD family hydrolase [Reichenbachiella sp.]|uniref:HAD family hydrolase n=1 Tax=Reichenbachiella sp. TaxID=2184521 RepID=UPI003297056C